MSSGVALHNIRMVTVSEAVTALPPRFDPIRTIGAAFSMPPQVHPDNLHGIFLGPERTALRDLAYAMRMHAGPVLLVTDERLLPPPGTPIGSLNLVDLHAPNLTRFPGYRALCEASAGDHVDLVRRAWDLTHEQEVPPGAYRRIALVNQSGGSIPGLLRLCGYLGLPDPQLRGNQMTCLVRSLDELRALAELHWLPCGSSEQNLARDYAAAESVVVAATDISLAIALERLDRSEGPKVHRRVSESLSGGVKWTPFEEPVHTLIARRGDARLPAILEIAFASIQQAGLAGDSRLKTIILDHELLNEQTAEVAETMARTGRKHHCSVLIMTNQVPTDVWSSVAGFQVKATSIGFDIAIDQHHTHAVEIAGAAIVSEAHAILHRSNG